MKRAPKALLFLILLSTPLQGAETDTVMRDVYDAISYLLPLSIRDAGRQTPWDKELVDAKLDTLLAFKLIVVRIVAVDGLAATDRVLSQAQLPIEFIQCLFFW